MYQQQGLCLLIYPDMCLKRCVQVLGMSIKGTEKEHDTSLDLYISFLLSQDDLEVGE